MKFSILIPVYDVEQYIERCVQSVLDQTYTDFEVILVDDGSTDSSGTLCDKLQSLDNRIKVFHKENRGQLHTREYAIKEAIGDYCVFLDSDDWINKDALEIFQKHILSTNCDCLVFGYKQVDENKNILLISPNEPMHGRLLNREYGITKILSESYNSLWRKVVKRRLIGNKDNSKFYGVRLGEDVIQSLEILENAQTYVFIDDRLYNYFFRVGSVSNLVDNRHLNDVVVYIEEIANFIEREKHLSNESKNMIIRRIANDLVGVIIMAFRSYGMNNCISDIFVDINSKIFYKDFFDDGLFRYVIGFKFKVVAKLFDWHQYRLLFCMIRIWDDLKSIREKRDKL